MGLVAFIPLVKVDEEKREVWGIAAEEAPDKSGEIMDYAASKPHFLKWSAEIQKASGGRSLGNVRAMHGNVAAGKLVALETVDDLRQVMVGAKIVDDQEWVKVREGVYNGFSIGGTYGKRWRDKDGVLRYEAIPHEISIVDNPAMYGATFTVVKADGLREEIVFPESPEGLAKRDLEEQARRIRGEWQRQFASDEDSELSGAWVRAVMEDTVIVETGMELYAYPYTAEGEAITFDSPTAVQVKYVPVAAAPEEPEEPEAEEAEEGEEAAAEMEQADAPSEEEEEALKLAGVSFEKFVAALDPLDARLTALEKAMQESKLDQQIAALFPQLAALEKRLTQLETQPATVAPVVRVVPGSGPGYAEGGGETLSIEQLRRLAELEPNPMIKADYNLRAILAEQALLHKHS